LLTAGAEALVRRLLGEGLGLAGEAEVEHAFGEDFADFQEEVFDVGKGGAPGGSVGAIELIDEVFGNALDVGADLFGFGGVFFGSCHPWFHSRLVSKKGNEFL
jgi:hypothetical protein